MYHISELLDIEAHKAEFAEQGVIQVRDFLRQDSAQALHSLLESQREWNLAFNKLGSHVDLSYRDFCSWTEQQKKTLSEVVWAQAATDFQYFYKSIPIFDIYAKKLLPDSDLNEVFELVNSSEFLSMMRTLVGDDSISFADVQATSFERGHFLKEHDDNVQGKGRVAAYVLNLTPNWNSDWGGLFHVLDDQEVVKTLVPTFNAINVFKVPRKHSVSYVTPFARGSRFSITGWLRRGELSF
ncbi:2OG-Fe(II) oxygenase [Microbulbifer marinus]|uniref:Proline 4-hydroxylase (Includes Rps23 Pro-64 3,4-dihydroxylase Tpa1), contains SM-20 domain n=1 Tax=Microbulbifer marinus TaxID=658218 RepID=A0A1H4AFR6_9GAMM|nr:2OG-Fe(II) oxygenase family protein [Microbulbifer marinus]SEA34913.1 Proline 4-hydroxylase (includes Rps23 Pro-64 3,4-dihydroxylase Tpa1), contains SM-20 domain [Microbulbifer marinus]